MFFSLSGSKQQLKMVTIGYYQTNCSVQIMDRIDCSVWENVPKNTLVFNAVELDSRFTSNRRYDLYTVGDIKPQHLR